MPLGGTRILCVRRLQSGANDQQRAGSIFLTMRSKAVIVARVLLGLVFFVFGLNGFLHWFPLPTMKAAAAEFMGGLVASGYFFPLLFGTYTIRAPDRPLRAARVDCARAGHREHRRRPPLPRSIRIPTYNPRRRA